MITPCNKCVHCFIHATTFWDEAPHCKLTEKVTVHPVTGEEHNYTPCSRCRVDGSECELFKPKFSYKVKLWWNNIEVKNV